MNKWNIPDWLEIMVRARDKHCIYCGLKFDPLGTSKELKPTWEHIVNDASIINDKNIALCCISCNASKGAKELSEWLLSKYCKIRKISKDTVAEVVKNHL